MASRISRRQFLTGLTVGGGAALIAACAQTTTSPTSGPAAAAPGATAPAVVSQPGSTVNIVYWGSFSGGLGEAEKFMVDGFNSSQTSVRVEYQYQGSYEETAQKFTAALQAQTIPDVVLLSDVWWFKFYLAQAIRPLDDLLAGAGIDVSDYEPVLLNEGKRKGGQFWIPFARSTPLFYYRKDKWQEAGLPDRAPETWAEFQEWAPKLMKKDGSTVTQAAFLHPNAKSYVAWLFQGVVWQFGGQYSTPDFTITMQDPNTVRASQFYRDTVHSLGWAVPSADINKDFVGGLGAAMMASTGGLAGIEKAATEAATPFEVGVGFLPMETSFGCPTGGAGLAIPAATSPEKAQAAMAFINYCTNTEGTTNWSQRTGYMPVRKSSVQSQSMQDFFKERPNFQTAVQQLPKTRAQDAARVFIPNGDQIIGGGMERILINNEDPATVWPDIVAELEKGAEPVLADLAKIEG